MKIKDIIWETDGEDVDLPTEVELPSNIDPNDEDAVNNYLSDTYGWLTIDWFVGNGRYEVYDSNDEVVASADDLRDAQDAAEHWGASFIYDTKEGEKIAV